MKIMKNKDEIIKQLYETRWLVELISKRWIHTYYNHLRVKSSFLRMHFASLLFNMENLLIKK